LGGGEVRLLDLTAAYAAFANGGQRVIPFAISRIETLDGEVLSANGLQVKKSQVQGASTFNLQPSTPAVDPRVAYLLTDILSDNNARVPAFGQGNMLEIGRPAAAKTGTTTDWRDNWTLGYTPDLTVGVWVGNADNTPMKGVSGISGAGPIWHDFMVAVLRERPPLDFDRPDGLVRVEVCADSGLLPGPANSVWLMANGGSQMAGNGTQGSHQPEAISYKTSAVPCPQRRYEWFIAGTEPTEVDRAHLEIAVDARTGGPADAATPPQYIQPQLIWQLPAEYAAWTRENGIPQLAQAGVGQGVGETAKVPPLPGASAPPLRLTSPDPNRVYTLDPGLPASAQQVPLTALLNDSIATAGPITLLVDGVPLASVAAPDYTAWWPLVAGQHTFVASATRTDGTHIESEPVMVWVESAGEKSAGDGTRHATASSIP
jgi:membrane carboxypeptidase/penicillin-binding protein PbpC